MSTAISYHLDVSTRAEFATTVFDQGSLPDTSQQVTGLANASTYYWRVGAKDAAGKSAWSGVGSFTTTVAPTLVAPTDAQNLSILPMLSWSSVPMATSYRLDVSTASDFSTTVYSAKGLTATSDSVNGLTNGQTYLWRVGAKNASGITGWSGVGSFTTTVAPTLVAPTDAQNLSILPMLSWSSVPMATSYRLDVSTASDFSTTVYSAKGLTATSDSVNGLTNGQTYLWRVGAKNASGITGWSGVGSFTTTGVPVFVVPTDAQNLSIVPVLSWSSVPTVMSYRLDVSTASDFSTTVYSAKGLTATSDSVNGLTNGQTYLWRVGAKNASGITGWSGVGSFTTTGVPVLVVPTDAQNLSIVPVLSWSSVPTVMSYRLDVSTASDFSTTVYSAKGLTATSDSVKGLANGQTYLWRVGAKNASGITGWSGVGSFMTTFAPTLVSPTNGAGNISISPVSYLEWRADGDVVPLGCIDGGEFLDDGL